MILSAEICKKIDMRMLIRVDSKKRHNYFGSIIITVVLIISLAEIALNIFIINILLEMIQYSSIPNKNSRSNQHN